VFSLSAARTPPLLQSYVLDRAVIGQHRDNGIAMADVGRPPGHHGGMCRKLVGSCPGAIANGETMACFEQTARHRAAQIAETNEPGVHIHASPDTT
jgi:hypothetical protein